MNDLFHARRGKRVAFGTFPGAVERMTVDACCSGDGNVSCLVLFRHVPNRGSSCLLPNRASCLLPNRVRCVMTHRLLFTIRRNCLSACGFGS